MAGRWRAAPAYVNPTAKTISRNDVVVSSATTVCNRREVEEAGAAWPTAKKDGGEGGEDAVEDGDGEKTG